MRMLNLGCGTKTSSRPGVINVDWCMYLRIKRSRVLRAMAPVFIRGHRMERFKTLPENVMVHNLSKRLPFDTNSVDYVYHCHVLEHLDREAGERLLLEVKRVLRPGGIQRIVVPDLEASCKAYLSHVCACEESAAEAETHDQYVAALIEQSVRKTAFGTGGQKPLRRFFETLVLGDARRRGETHQWMYDRVNLRAILARLGYVGVRVQEYNTSLIPNWSQHGLDLDEDGNEYLPDSLYVEAMK